MLELVLKVLTVVGLGVVELWLAIPAGFALQLHPVVTAAAAALGATLAALAVIILGERARAWLLRRRGGEAGEAGRHERLHRIWNRYGVAGLGLLSPLLTGAPLGAALGMALGAPGGRLLLWMGIGIVLWSAGLTAAVALGLVAVDALRG